MKLHASGEDYLEAVLVLKQEKGMVRSVDLTVAFFIEHFISNTSLFFAISVQVLSLLYQHLHRLLSPLTSSQRF